jgi:hypothetical protein
VVGVRTASVSCAAPQGTARAPSGTPFASPAHCPVDTACLQFPCGLAPPRTAAASWRAPSRKTVEPCCCPRVRRVRWQSGARPQRQWHHPGRAPSLAARWQEPPRIAREPPNMPPYSTARCRVGSEFRLHPCFHGRRLRSTLQEVSKTVRICICNPGRCDT